MRVIKRENDTVEIELDLIDVAIIGRIIGATCLALDDPSKFGARVGGGIDVGRVMSEEIMKFVAKEVGKSG